VASRRPNADRRCTPARCVRCARSHSDGQRQRM